MKHLYNYLTGRVPSAPSWFYRIPPLVPIYTGHNAFLWLGLEFQTPDPLLGDTLFMYWRRQRHQ